MGPLETCIQAKFFKKLGGRITNEAVSDISNLDASGKVAPNGSKMHELNISNQFWHSDASYDRHPFRYSMLSAVQVPEWGGETEFADLRAAYDALDTRRKALIADRIATFFAMNNRLWLGIQDSPEQLAAYPPVRWPMVRTHAASGRKVIWCDTKVTQVSGMSVYEGRALAHDLIEHSTQREFVYSHGWRPGDLVLWDNRSVLHRGRPFDITQPREMRRVSTIDDTESTPVKNPDRFAMGRQAA